MDLVKRSLSRWIQAALILVIGILCIVAGASGNGNPNTAQNATDAISIVIGIVLIVIGALAVILALVLGIMAKKGFAANAITGGFALAIGISLLCNHYAAGLIGLLIYVVPFILIVIGSIIFADGIYLLIRGIVAKETKKVLVPSIISMVIGVAAIMLGALCLNGNVIGYNVQFIIFGIVLCVVAALMVLLTFVALPAAVVAVVSVEKEDK